MARRTGTQIRPDNLGSAEPSHRECRDHPNKEITHFCLNCVDLLCPCCCKSVHKGHKTIGIAKSKTHLQQWGADCIPILFRASSSLQFKHTEAEKQRDDDITCAQDIKANLIEAKKKLLECIDRTFDTVLDDLSHDIKTITKTCNEFTTHTKILYEKAQGIDARLGSIHRQQDTDILADALCEFKDSFPAIKAAAEQSIPNASTRNLSGKVEVVRHNISCAVEEILNPDHADKHGKTHVPRLCILQKWPSYNGYGFNIRSDNSTHIHTISRMVCGSPSEKSGLQVEDKIIEVNGKPTSQSDHAQVLATLKAIHNRVELLVLDPDGVTYFESRGIQVDSSMSAVKRIECSDDL